MSGYIGIDIGAVSITAAVWLDGSPESAPPTGLLQPADAPRSGGVLYLTPYRRTRGRPLESARELLSQITEALPPGTITAIAFTGSATATVAKHIDGQIVNEFKAAAMGLAAIGLHARTVLEMGGESSKYLRLNFDDPTSPGIIDYATNGDCAAGTGSFIDQQAGRLKYAIEEVGPLVLQADRAAQVAGRCSVFAKSDMIHAQQKGYSPAEVLRGLCNAVANNFRAAVVRSHPIEKPVAFIGGVAENQAVARSLAETFDLGENELRIPAHPAHIPAIGTAAVLRKKFVVEKQVSDADSAPARPATNATFPTHEPLSMRRVLLLRDQDEKFESFNGETVPAYLGIDIGSVSTNLVLIDEQGRIIHEIYTRTLGRPIEVVSQGLKDLHRAVGNHITICGVGTTGSGRELIGKLVGADTINDEITAHKTGATFVGRTLLDGRIPDTIFEIGGQDSKYIALSDGVVTDFTMNEACAAGTGSFLEERAEELDISIKGEFAELALSSPAPIRLGERCTVFMERDVNSYLHQGARKEDLIAGLAYSVVYNYINRVVRGRKIGQTIFFQGGTAYNDAVAAAFAAVTGKEIIIPPHNGVIGAIGAALLARERMLTNAEPDENERTGVYVSDTQSPRRSTRFRGYDLNEVDYTLREFTCKACSNFCQIQEFAVEGEKTYWGDKCSDRYRKAAESGVKPVIEDLFAFRQKLMEDESGLPPIPAGAKTIGIPRTMFAMEMLPFWRTLFRRCGFDVVLSNPTNKQIVQTGLDTVVAEPCFPIIAAHGHVTELARREDVDYLFVPNILSLETSWTEVESHLCPWHQTVPYVCRQAPLIKPFEHKLLVPTLHFYEGRKLVSQEIREMLQPLGVGRRAADAAIREAFLAQEAFRGQLVNAGKKALARLEKNNAKAVVLVGRPYNIHDAGMSLSVASKLRDRYGVNCIPMDFLDVEPVDITDINDNMFWSLGRKILAASKLVRQYPNLHIICITNFKCGPDSFVKHFIRGASGKPFLTLQLDGHSNDAGVMTRCEAYLDSIGILRPWKPLPQEQQTPVGWKR